MHAQTPGAPEPFEKWKVEGGRGDSAQQMQRAIQDYNRTWGPTPTGAGTTKDNTRLAVQSCRQGGQRRRRGDNNHGGLLQVVELKLRAGK